MIRKLIDTLFYPDMGGFAFQFYDGLRSKELTLDIISDLIVTLNRLSMYSYYEIENEYFKAGLDYRYWEHFELCADAMRFALLCLQKLIVDKDAAKHGALVTLGDFTLDFRELKSEIEHTIETIGDKDESFVDDLERIDEFISWIPDNYTDLRFDVLDKINASNSDIVYGFCRGYGRIATWEKLKVSQPVSPEDLNTIDDVKSYHSQMTHSSFCYCFLDMANNIERQIGNNLLRKESEIQTLKELLLAIAKFDAFLHCKITFPCTIYRLLTDETFDVHLKSLPGNE